MEETEGDNVEVEVDIPDKSVKERARWIPLRLDLNVRALALPRKNREMS